MKLSLRKFSKYLFISISILIVLLAVSVALIPSALKWGVHHWFEQQHLESDIDRIELQLFSGRLSLHNFSVRQGQQQTLKLASLVVQIDPREILNRKIILQQFSLKDFSLLIEQKQGQTVSLAGVSMPVTSASPTTKSVTRTAASTWQLEVQNIDLGQLNVCYHQKFNTGQELCSSLQKLKWHGQLKLDLHPVTTNLLASLQTDLSLTLQGLKLIDTHRGTTLAGFDRLSLDGINIHGLETIKIVEGKLNGLIALQRPANVDNKTKNYVLKSRSLVASDITILKRHNISFSDITARNFNFSLQRDKDGKLEAVNILKTYQTDSASSSVTTTTSDTTSPVTFKLAKLAIKDKSSFHFIDKAVVPISEISLNDIQFSIQDIDSTKKQSRSPLQMDLQPGQDGEVNLKGDIMLFAERPTLKVDGHLEAINLSDFNAYTQQAIQHYVKSGHLDADTSINIEQGKLNSTTQLTLHKFYVEPVTEQEATQYEEQLGLPLGSALSLLRDSDDSIHLTLPITGDINAPDFSINNVISKVSTKAIKTAVINYYTPLGVFTLAGSLYDLATALRFKPVEFEVSDASLDDNAKEHLDKLTVILNERKKIHMVICGVTTQADRLAWFPDEFESTTNDEDETVTSLPRLNEDQSLRLNQLAEQRGLIVKTYLQTQKKIEPKRLILCIPKHRPGDTSLPRVELQL